MNRLFTLLLSLLSLAAQAQTTLKITAVPANTPASAILYVAGTFNGWNPGDAAYALAYDAADASYSVTLPASVTGTIEYKFTRGTWAMVETNATNGSITNRRYIVGSSPGPVLHQVLNWEDLGSTSVPSTATSNVSVLSTSFAMPQLGRTRRVWLYLPNDYATSTRRYPVLYLQDGQNIFDARTAFAGEWGVDETLSQLQASGQDATGCIVVAVDNGANRLDEYSPCNNPQYGGGQGAAYIDFLAQTLKPYIDANYRTLPGRENTGIAGSSMGALIATYAAVRYPAIYGKVGSLSPAYWFARQPLLQYLQQHPANPDTRFYFVSGTTESSTMVADMAAVRDSLQRHGVPATNLNFNTRTDGQHAEWFWRREFGPAYQWLYAAATPTAMMTANKLKFSVHPNPGTGLLRLSLPATAEVQVRDALGRAVLHTTLPAGQLLDLRALQQGTYFVQLTTGSQTGVSRWVKE
jgi:metallo-beta-lactamase class B